MRVGVFHPYDNEEHNATLAAFAKGILAGGDDVLLAPFDCYNTNDFDVAVVFGVYKKHVAASIPRGQIIDLQQRTGKPVVILEKGFVKRDQYYMAGVGGLNGRAKFNNSNSPPDRWNQLNIQLQPFSSNQGGPILLVGQVPWDASVQHTDHIRWLTETAKRLRFITTRKIIFRAHPLAEKATPSILGTTRSVNTLQQDFSIAHSVVTFNSNTGVDATLAGLPVFAFDEGSMIWHIASKDLTLIEKPTIALERRQWAYNLAYTQWTHEEMRDGAPWLHLKPYIQSLQRATA